jgi:hypothetical protein
MLLVYTQRTRVRETGPTFGYAWPPAAGLYVLFASLQLKGNNLSHPAALKAATGVAGLDDVTAGGFQRGRLFLIETRVGSGALRRRRPDGARSR